MVDGLPISKSVRSRPAFPFADFIPKEGIFLAECDGAGILLDLSADRYLSLDEMSTATWRYFSRGCSFHVIATLVARDFGFDPEAAEEEVAAQLLVWKEEGLVASPATYREASLPTGRPPRSPATAAVSSAELATAIFSLRYVWLLLKAHVWTRWNLGVRGLATTLAKLQRGMTLPQQSPGLDANLLRMVKVFRMLRLPFCQGRDDCLSRSIQLAYALGAIGLGAELCIGVDRFPFRAHAWLESGELVLSEAAPRLERFVVIARF